jgi:GNAT superfamily N-acetyltransferase
MDRAQPILRVATPDDASRVEALMKESAAAIFPRYYDKRQSASAVHYVAQVDPMLLADGTYFVLESDGELVACGGWSRRDRLYTGSSECEGDSRTLDPATEPAKVRAMFVRADWTRRGLGRRIIEECESAARREGFRQLALLATLPGVPLYLACGFVPLEEVEITLSDGVRIAGVPMEKWIDSVAGANRRRDLPRLERSVCLSALGSANQIWQRGVTGPRSVRCCLLPADR